MSAQARIRPWQIVVPFVLAALIALAALSYFATRPSISAGSVFEVEGAITTGPNPVVAWRTGTEIAIVTDFIPSRKVRVRSITLIGVDPKNAYISSIQYGLWDGRTTLPSFNSVADLLPPTVNPRAVTGAFTVPAHGRVMLRIVVSAVADAKATSQIIGLRVDGESWSWAHTTDISFPQPIDIQKP